MTLDSNHSQCYCASAQRLSLSCLAPSRRSTFVVFAWVATVYTACLCAAMVIAPGALAQRTRRAAGIPYLRAGLLAACAVTLSILSLSIVSSHGQLSLAACNGRIYSVVLALDSVKELISGRPVATSTLLTGAMGALLAAAAIQGLLSLRTSAGPMRTFSPSRPRSRWASLRLRWQLWTTCRCRLRTRLP